MQIHVNANGRNICIPIPTHLVFNSLGALLFQKFVVPQVDSLSEMTYAQTRTLMRGFCRARRHLKGQPLVDVESTNGEKVQIFL